MHRNVLVCAVGLVHTERTLDCGVSPLVKGALLLLMLPFVVDCSACGDIKSYGVALMVL